MASSVGRTRVAGMVPTLVRRLDGSMGDYQPADDRYDSHGLPLLRPQRAEAAAALARAVAELRHRPARGDAARDPAPGLRPGRDALRPRQQLRAAVRPRRGELRAFLRDGLQHLRDELVISTKAGYDMWPGPYGQGGGSRKYVLSSLDQSLERLGLDYVDIFYSHRFDPETPVEETMQALDTAVRSGRALYAGISSYSPAKTREAATIARELGHAVADPPAVVLDAEPLDREGPARRARGAGDGLHRVHARWPRACSPTATSTGSPRTRAPPAATAPSRATTSTRPRSSTSARSTRSPRRAVRSSPSSPCSGRCATAG